MKITVVMGFFLPMPPEAGGAIEKSWHRLAQMMVQRGHEVTLISRRWNDWPHEETKDGVHYIRLKGYNHHSRLWLNLICDFVWSWRVFFRLPNADIVALNTISLGCWLSKLKPRAGRVVAMLGRMPKGQFKVYPAPARIFVPSEPVQTAVEKERPSFQSLIKSIGYPIDEVSLSQAKSGHKDTLTLLYVGRIHREKGVSLIIEAALILAQMELPSWQLLICGPSDISRGGSGVEYLERLKMGAPSQISFLDPIFEEKALHALYRKSDIFCYPSLADQGETFGVSVAEAMAAGAVPVVSQLACFQDFLTPGVSGLSFDAHAPDAAKTLAARLVTLIRDAELRDRLSRNAQLAVKRFGFDQYTDDLLLDFKELTHPSIPSS